MKIKNITRTATLLGSALAVTLLSSTSPKSINPNRHFQRGDVNTKVGERLQKMFKDRVGIDRAHAVASIDKNKPEQRIKDAVFFVLGYPTRQQYIDYACEGTDPGDGNSCDGPPQAGLVGGIADIANDLSPLLGAAGISSCAAIPSSGTATVTSGGQTFNITYETPTGTVPASWDDGGTTYGKRVKFDTTFIGEDMTVSMEFSCDGSAKKMAINMPVGSHAVGFDRRINVIIGEKSGNGVSEVYISEYDSTNDKVRGAYAFAIEVNESASNYVMSGVMTNQIGSNPTYYTSVDRIAINGNYSTGAASVFMNTIALANYNTTGNPVDVTDLSGITGYNSVADLSATGFNFTSAETWNENDNVERQGCFDFTAGTAPASATLCTGYALSAPGTPSIHASGGFHADWLLNTMHDHIDVSGL